ncbi:MAG: hypothetical protein Crog4KO_25810 [Crocinitomicaceae bacterium]
MDIDAFSTISILIPTIVGIFLFSKVPSSIKLVIYYVWVTTVLDAIVFYLGLNSINNLYLFHVHTYIEFSFILVLFGNLIQSKRKVHVLNLAGGLFLTISIFLLAFHQDFSQFNSVQRHIEGFFVTLIILFFLAQQSMGVKRLTNTPINVLSWALLLYFGGNLFVFALGDVILTTGGGEMWVIHGILNIILNVVFAYVILASRNTYKHPAK